MNYRDTHDRIFLVVLIIVLIGLFVLFLTVVGSFLNQDNISDSRDKQCQNFGFEKFVTTGGVYNSETYCMDKNGDLIPVEVVCVSAECKVRRVKQ